MLWPDQKRVDKTKTFGLMEKLGFVKAILNFDGGNDEGGVNSIRLYRAGEPETYEAGTELEVFDGWRRIPNPEKWNGYDYVEAKESDYTEEERLSELLCRPVDVEFGSWGGAPSTSGSVVWTLADKTVKMDYEQDHPVSDSAEW